MLAGSIRAVERSIALASVKAGEMSTCQGHPCYAVPVDIHSPRREAFQRLACIIQGKFVILHEGSFSRVGSRLQPDDRSRISQRRSPYRTVCRRGNGKKTL